jgi:hypothetical protein
MGSHQLSERDASFHVRRSFGLQSRTLFVISGDIVDGQITSGMEVDIPLNSAVSITVVVAGVEFIDRPNRHEVGLQ